MKLEDLKVGAFIDLGIINPACDDYGPLMVESVTRKTEKYNTSWGDMWYHPKPNYIDRDEIFITVINHGGERLEKCWWADEFECFDEYILLKADNKEDAFEEFRILRAEKDARDVAKYLEFSAYDQKMGQRYSMSTLGAMDRLAEDYEITNNEKIKELHDALNKVVELARGIYR